jgi:hypothetical protein
MNNLLKTTFLVVISMLKLKWTLDSVLHSRLRLHCKVLRVDVNQTLETRQQTEQWTDGLSTQ